MKIIRPYARIIQGAGLIKHGLDIEAMKKIEWCARISHRSEEAGTADSWKRFINEVVIKHGDWSVVEHVTATVDSITDRGITHESVRHRLFSFTQESTRFVNYEKKMPPAFIYPQVEIECLNCLGRHPLNHYVGNGRESVWYHPDSTAPSPDDDCKYDPDWLDAIACCEDKYKKLLAKKWRPQEARSVFPNALASRIVTTGNLRNWRHYFIMRSTLEAHPQMRQITIPLLAEFKETFPILFDDIEPNMKQSESMKRAR